VRKADALGFDLNTAVERVAVEPPKHERVQAGEERHVRVVAERISERNGAVGGQLGEQPIRDRAHAFVLLRLRSGSRLADDGSPAAVAASGDVLNRLRVGLADLRRGLRLGRGGSSAGRT
jgi:hypothetical protein